MADALNAWNSTAAMAVESRVRATEGRAVAERMTAFDAKVAASESNLTQLERVVATNESAMSLQIGQLNAAVGQTNASVQTTSQALATLDKKASTMWSVKMQVNSQGQYVAAGIGLGIENGPAGLQSRFLVSADSFAVVNGINGTLSSPFVVQGGQVFINQAFINTAFIQQIILGMTLRSQAVDAQGRPLIELNMVSGSFTVRGQDADGSTLLNNRGLYVYDKNSVERAALGRLS